MNTITRIAGFMGMLAAALASRVMAQEGAVAAAAPSTSLTLELNALKAGDNSCRVTFLATNALGHALDKAAFEVALFDKDGSIDRLVTLDFKTLAEGKTKVLQFELAKMQCDGISRVLINDVAACTGAGVEPSLCLDHLATVNRTTIVFGL
ncbi:MAG TPA: hypothetical protein VGM83_09005 [Devosiaceae bacterium]|jgi:hypothetical protein